MFSRCWQFTTGVYEETAVMYLCVCVFQVSLEVIEELCYEMGLHRLEAMEEYAIFLVTGRGVLTDVCFLITHTQTHTKRCVSARGQSSRRCQ